MKTEEIIKIAYQLGQAIADSKQIAAIKKTQQEIYLDISANDLIMRYQEAKDSLEKKAIQGLPLSPQEENLMNSLEDQMNSHRLIKEFVLAQENFNSLMQSVYFALNKSIAADKGSTACTTCHGSCNV